MEHLKGDVSSTVFRRPVGLDFGTVAKDIDISGPKGGLPKESQKTPMGYLNS